MRRAWDGFDKCVQKYKSCLGVFVELLKMAKSLLVMHACVNKHNMKGLEVYDFFAFEDERTS